MTILLVYDTLYPYAKGGGEKRLYEIALQLVQKGHRVIWLCSKNWDHDEAEFIHNGIHVIGLSPVGNRSGKALRRGLSGALRFALLVWKYNLSKERIDLIWAGQTPWVHILALSMNMARHQQKIPILIDCWEVWEKYWYEYYGYAIGSIGRIVERLLLKKADFVVGISDMTVNKIKHYRKTKVYLAHNGIEVALINSIEQSPHQSDLIYFGRLVPHKNVDLIIEATKILVQDYPNIKVFILGGGDQQSYLKDLTSSYGLSDNIRFFGFMDDYTEAISLLKASKIFIQPSTSEGGGSIAVFEAQACGLPVIAIKHPQGIDESLIKTGVNGDWIDTKNPTHLSEKVKSFLNNKLLSEKISKSSANSVQQYDWHQIASIYENILEEVKSL